MEVAALSDTEQDSQAAEELSPDILTADEEARLANPGSDLLASMQKPGRWTILLAVSALLHLGLVVPFLLLWTSVPVDPEQPHQEIPVDVVVEQKSETPPGKPKSEPGKNQGTSSASAEAKQKEEASKAKEAAAQKAASASSENKSEPEKQDAAKSDKAKNEPAKNKNEPVKQDSAKQEASKAEPPKAEPAAAERPKAEQPKPEAPKQTAKSEPPKTPPAAKAAAAKPAGQGEANKSEANKAEAAKAPAAKAAAKPGSGKSAPARQENAGAEGQASPPQARHYAMGAQAGRMGAPDKAQALPQPGGPLSQNALDQTLARAGYGFDPDRFRAVAVPMPSEDGDELMSYKLIVFGLLERAKHYPETALQRGARGRAVVGFSLDDSGQVVDLELLQSSGEADLDVESLALVDRASPFPAPPPGAQRTFAAEIGFGVSSDDE